MAFFRVAHDFVINGTTSCPNKFDNFYQLFKNLHEQLNKVLEDSQERVSMGSLLPPPPPAPPPLNFGVSRTRGTKNAIRAEAERFLRSGGLLEQFGKHQVYIRTYEQFTEMKACWQPEAQKIYDTLVLDCFCRFFNNCRLFLSAFLNELCSKFPTRTQNLDPRIKAVLKNQNS